MHRWFFFLAVFWAACGVLPAQWQIQDSGTDADLHGIDVDGGVAWVSGTKGTVLRSEDGGYSWQKCAIPPGAEQLDFRGIQALDGNTAIVMSSGKGDLSRLYKTTDSCQSWKRILQDPDRKGSWAALHFDHHQWGWLLGEPVSGRFVLFYSDDSGQTWQQMRNKGLETQADDEASFTVSNSSMVGGHGTTKFGIGGKAGAFVLSVTEKEACVDDCVHEDFLRIEQHAEWTRDAVPIGGHSESSGIFSMAERQEQVSLFSSVAMIVAVGGDSAKPDDAERTAAYTTDSGKSWHAAQTPPHGFRSSVVYDAASKAWIAVGPNGTDISTDDGRNWRALLPNPALHDAPNADRDWNALALPFAVGPHGRIGRLNRRALAKPGASK